MVSLEEINNSLTVRDKWIKDYHPLIKDVCWGCPGALEKAYEIVKRSNYIPNDMRLKKYVRKPVKDTRGNDIKSQRHIHIFQDKPIKGLPNTITPVNETDEIVSLLEKHFPDLFKQTYEKVDPIEDDKKDEKELKNHKKNS